MFLSAHYAGEDLVLKLNPGEPWKKVFGPVFMYLNSVMDKDNALSLWDDAKEQVQSIELLFMYWYIQNEPGGFWLLILQAITQISILVFEGSPLLAVQLPSFWRFSMLRSTW